MGSNSERTAGELLLERYLVANGYLNFEFERPVNGSARVPDYTLVASGEQFLDVKDFEPDSDEDLRRDRGRPFDAYRRIRKKIQKLQEKFKDDVFERYCCCGVLCSPGIASDVHLDRPSIVIPAMLGDEMINVPRDGSEPFLSFGKGGKMIHRGEPQNTTISALITLDLVAAGEYRLERHLNRIAETREVKPFEDVLADLGPDQERQPAVIVWENPFARRPLPRDLFCGPYDAHWGVDESDGKIRRIFAGRGRRLMEEEEGARYRD